MLFLPCKIWNIELFETYSSQLVSRYSKKRNGQPALGQVLAQISGPDYALVFGHHRRVDLVVHLSTCANHTADDTADLGTSLGFGAGSPARQLLGSA